MATNRELAPSRIARIARALEIDDDRCAMMLLAVAFLLAAAGDAAPPPPRQPAPARATCAERCRIACERQGPCGPRWRDEQCYRCLPECIRRCKE